MEPRTLWRIDESGNPAAVQVMAGLSDGTKTEIRSEEDADLEGVNIILRERI
jgi:hypothetical protein